MGTILIGITMGLVGYGIFYIICKSLGLTPKQYKGEK